MRLTWSFFLSWQFPLTQYLRRYLTGHPLRQVVLFYFLYLLAACLVVVMAAPLWLIWIVVLSPVVAMALRPVSWGLTLFAAIFPFSLILPYSLESTLSSWRLMVAVLFLRFIYEYRSVLRLSQIQTFIRQHIFRYEKAFFWLLVWGVVTAAWARFALLPVKQALYIGNVLVIYALAAYLARHEKFWRQILLALTLGLVVVVLLGFIQLMLFSWSSPWLFWQYWAAVIIPPFYGLELGQVSSYSNSWFTFAGASQSLRMFSILPDSHSFGLLTAGLITVSLIWLATYQRRLVSGWKKFLDRQSLWWVLVFIAGLAIILSGTRGVWVGLLPPLVLSLFGLVLLGSRPMWYRQILAYAMVIVCLVLAPLFTWSVNHLHSTNTDQQFFSRAQSIYDLGETSNAGRLTIWGKSLSYLVRHPFGAGWGNFLTAITQTQPGAEFSDVANQHNRDYNLPQKFVTAHNLYLQILVETGVIGLGLFIWFWYLFFRQIWMFYHRSGGQGIYRSAVVAVTFFCLWLLAHGLFDLTWLNDRVLLLTMILFALIRPILQGEKTFVDGLECDTIKA